MPVLLLQWLTHLASTLYGGTVLVFALLLHFYPHGADRPRAEVARVFRATGVVLGLSMGVWVFAMLALRWVDTGAFRWAWDTPAARHDLATWGVFALLWASSFVLEIWTLEPVRAPDDAEAFDRGYVRTARHLAANALLFLVWQALWISG